MKKILLTLTVVGLVFTSCDKDNPIATDIAINFTHTVDGSDLITNSMIYTNDAGENYDVQTLKYLISNITLHTANGSSLQLDEVHFIDISDQSTFSLTYNDVPNNNYTSFSFEMGLDSDNNISNAYVNENFFGEMEWPDIMGGGYHYMKLEGSFDNILSYGTHTGGTMGMDYSFNNIDDISLIVTDDLGNVDVNINMEINNWYQTPNQIEFSTYYTIHMTSGDTIAGIMMSMEKQMQLKQNGMTDVFSVTLDK